MSTLPAAFRTQRTSPDRYEHPLWQTSSHQPTLVCLFLPVQPEAQLEFDRNITRRTRHLVVALPGNLVGLAALVWGTVKLLDDLLPMKHQLSISTLSRHAYQVAERLEGELGGEQLSFAPINDTNCQSLVRPSSSVSIAAV